MEWDLTDSCISIDTFNGITDYIITKDQLCGRTVRISIKDVDIVGFPMQISSHHYFRNEFNFNVCFVVKRGKSHGYEAMVKKTVLKLEYLEREKGFLQQPNILVVSTHFSLSLDDYERHSGDHLHQSS